MNYIYKHTHTCATTGYFECAPDPAPNLEQSLEHFHSRPFDTFLHRHIIKLILELDPIEYENLAKQAGAGEDQFLRQLIWESADGNRKTFLKNLGWDKFCVDDNTRLECLTHPQSESGMAGWRGIFHANIHAHQPIPDQCSQLFDSDYCLEGINIIKSRQGALAALACGGKKQPPSDSLSALKSTYAAACEVLEKNGLCAGPEMRHEASLSPIALLRSWNLFAGLQGGRNAHTLKGVATAYGRGLSLVRARVSCAMEIIERASAHILITGDGKKHIGDSPVIYGSWARLEKDSIRALSPRHFSNRANYENIPLHWIPGRAKSGEEIFVPAQAAYLFCNLDEPMLFEVAGSTGLAAGSSVEGAKLASLLEIIERDAHASTPFDRKSCFELTARDPVILSLLEDYRWRGIKVQFQDITTEIGAPAYRCFVYGHDGSVAQAAGADLCGARAALSALTETPWPYVWANPVPAPSGPGLPNLPVRVLEDLPNYSLHDSAADLDLLENALLKINLLPVYVDLARPQYHFPVFRTFLPGLEIDPELESGPSPRLLARASAMKKGF